MQIELVFLTFTNKEIYNEAHAMIIGIVPMIFIYICSILCKYLQMGVNHAFLAPEGCQVANCHDTSFMQKNI